MIRRTTTARRSRSSALAAAVAGLALLVQAPATAHRLDEYLQAVRIAIDPGRIDLDLDLTPGIAIAPGVLAEIDTDANGTVTTEESRAYAARVLRDVTIALDGRPLTLAVTESRVPAIAAIQRGEGTIRLQMTALVERVVDGTHRLFYRNDHRPDIGVYLANALVPASTRVEVVTQRRDPAQREITIEYALGRARTLDVSWWALIGGAGLVLAVIVLRSRSRRHDPSV